MEMNMDLDLIYKYKGKKYTLNSNLVNRQNLSQNRVDSLKRSHIIKLRIFERMELTDDIFILVLLSRRIKRLEFIQQDLWGFKRDVNHHYWFTVPKCTCPVLDNYDYVGTDMNYYDPSCIVHSNKSLDIYNKNINRIKSIGDILNK